MRQPLAMRRRTRPDFLGRRAGFVRVLQQVQQSLFELRGVEARGVLADEAFGDEIHLRAQWARKRDHGTAPASARAAWRNAA
jgi:hypothetical protein